MAREACKAKSTILRLLRRGVYLGTEGHLHPPAVHTQPEHVRSSLAAPPRIGHHHGRQQAQPPTEERGGRRRRRKGKKEGGRGRRRKDQVEERERKEEREGIPYPLLRLLPPLPPLHPSTESQAPYAPVNSVAIQDASNNIQPPTQYFAAYQVHLKAE